MIIDDVIIAVRISTNDNDINNNYNIYIKGQAKAYRWMEGSGRVRVLVL